MGSGPRRRGRSQPCGGWATPSFEVLQAVFGTRKHVLVEKPLCTRVEDWLRVAAQARERRPVDLRELGLQERPTPRYFALVR